MEGFQTGKRLSLNLVNICLLGTLRSDNGDGNGNVRSLGRAGLRPVGVPAKIEVTNFTSENVDVGQLMFIVFKSTKDF